MLRMFFRVFDLESAVQKVGYQEMYSFQDRLFLSKFTENLVISLMAFWGILFLENQLLRMLLMFSRVFDLESVVQKVGYQEIYSFQSDQYFSENSVNLLICDFLLVLKIVMMSR